MKRKILIALLCAAMLLLCSCGENKPAEENGKDVWNPSVSQRAQLEENHVLCGVLYLGYAESDMLDLEGNRPYYDNLMKESGRMEEFSFLKDIPNRQFVSTDMGHDLYLIIPTDPKSEVTVNQIALDEANDFVPKTEAVLYQSKNGAPFLLQCNYSDIFSDAEVVITDSHGETLRWSPFISLRNGKVQTDAEDGKKVTDFTEYGFSDEDDED